MRATIAILTLLTLISGAIAWRTSRSAERELTGLPPELAGTWVSELPEAGHRTLTLTGTSVRWTTGDGPEVQQPILGVLLRVGDAVGQTTYIVRMQTDDGEVESLAITLHGADVAIVGGRSDLTWRRTRS
ncbi:MAG TPA: hypothetical protein VMT85_12395 [Thermoanaerobaculia bacterium]|nr:hypothetical protein [Thermoanaerobaculia bacterium]